MALDTTSKDTSIELRAYNPALAGSIVFARRLGLFTGGVPVEKAPIEAHFHIRDNGRTKLALSFGAGLTWIDQLKAVHIQITNEQVSFIRTSSEMDYSFYVVWENGAVKTIREGTVTAVKVA